jgi:hypothetical protein
MDLHIRDAMRFTRVIAAAFFNCPHTHHGDDDDESLMM